MTRLPPRIRRDQRGVKLKEPDVERSRVGHLAFIRQLPCTSCWNPAPNEAHHLLGAEFGKSMGKKALDRWTIPLCRECHMRYHQGDRDMLVIRGIDERALAKRLFFISQSRGGDVDEGRRSVQRAKQPAQADLIGDGG